MRLKIKDFRKLLKEAISKDYDEIQRPRISLTFGVMPSKEKFIERVDDDGFPMTVRGMDAKVADLALGGSGNSQGFNLKLGGGDLYKFVKELVDLSESSDGEFDMRLIGGTEGEDISYRNTYDDEEHNKIREAAGSLASNIMDILGFEWI